LYRIVTRKCRIVRLFRACSDPSFYFVEWLFFLWESIGQYQQRLGSGTGFGTFGGGGERKGYFGITSEEEEPDTVSGNWEWWKIVPLCAVLTVVANGSTFAPALSSTCKGIGIDVKIWWGLFYSPFLTPPTAATGFFGHRDSLS
jgi:hypothetical protein